MMLQLNAKIALHLADCTPQVQIRVATDLNQLYLSKSVLLKSDWWSFSGEMATHLSKMHRRVRAEYASIGSLV